MPNKPTHELFSLGYQRWPAPRRWERLTELLESEEEECLVDIRIAPCSSDTSPASNYGPKPWTLQAGSRGIAEGLRRLGIEYHWLPELGNPQKNDKQMRVLRKHLSQPEGNWPVPA